MLRDAGLAVVADEVIGLLADCVRTETVNPPGNEERMTALLARYLEPEGLAVEVQALSPGRANLLGRVAGTGGGCLTRPRTPGFAGKIGQAIR